MSHAASDSALILQGLHVHVHNSKQYEAVASQFQSRLNGLGLAEFVTVAPFSESAPVAQFRLTDDVANEWSPDRDTTQLCERLQLDTQTNAADLEREILLTMLLSPVAFEFPSYDELDSAIRVRQNIVEDARKTALAFATSTAERPLDYWHYQDGEGFLVLPGKSLIEALQKATQPDRSGTLYSFSCYRATEYVMALALAREAARCNPELLVRMQRQAEMTVIRSGEFHRVFCREYGSRSSPLPPRFYVPGDRTWFRNPDSHSSDAAGFEGSWVFYLGNNQFTNFWKRDEVFTLTTKCVEIFHWRHGTYRDDSGDLQMNEARVAEFVRASLSNPHEVAEILERMLRISDPSGIYSDGGCIDISREYPRLVRPETTDLVMPKVPAPIPLTQ